MSAHIVTSSLFCLVTDVINIKIQAFMKFVEKHQAGLSPSQQTMISSQSVLVSGSSALLEPRHQRERQRLHCTTRETDVISSSLLTAYNNTPDSYGGPGCQTHISLTGKVFNHSILCADRMTSTNILFLIYYFHILLN